MTVWLNVVGIGTDGLEGLSPAARTLVATAEILIGGERHLAMVPGNGADRMDWQWPIERTFEAIAAKRGKRVTVLATGDPMSFGIGVALSKHFDAEEMAVIPHIGAFTLACSRLNWPLHEVETLTLHGRPLERLNLHMAPGARLLILSENGDTPGKVASALKARGFGPSRLVVLEEMGAAGESRIEATAEGWNAPRCKDLNTIAVECRAGKDATFHARVPGLPDDAFEHDGQITKREVRAITISALAPVPGARLWDVGAGSGSIAIEWLRAADRTEATAIERQAARRAAIARNAAALGVPDLEIVEGSAPAALGGLKAPDAVFIGAALTAPGLIEACWDRLKPKGRLVANAVTVESEAVLARASDGFGGRLTRIAISRAEPLGQYGAWRGLIPVTQLAAIKA
jgi:precorrin-6Y C5,15-methyltransferase (decarboxylating)